jgi:cell pole-organizing protein PopZ
MQGSGREPSMEDILASIKKVIAEEKELRTAVAAAPPASDEQEEEVLELDQPLEPLAPPADLGPPLVDAEVAEESRRSFEELTTVAASVPPAPPVNPLEEMVRDMLKPILKQWVDEHLPGIVNDHVKREISRITGRKLN